MPKFSVVVPAYNRASLLPRCLDSLMKQELDDFEVIVADDGSTDETRDVVHLASLRDKRIQYQHQQHRGAGAARNLGAGVAQGRYVAFLDSDDEARPNWLRRLHDTIESQQANVVCCGGAFVDEQGTIERIRLPDEGSRAKRVNAGLFLSGTFAMQMDVFKYIGGYSPDLPANQHSELRLRLLPMCDQRGWTMACIHEPLVRLHSHSGPKIRSDPRAIYESGLYVLNAHGAVLREHPPSFADWSTACGGFAAKLGRYAEARMLFTRAICAYPWKLKNFARLAAVCAPGVRSLIWRADRARN